MSSVNNSSTPPFLATSNTSQNPSFGRGSKGLICKVGLCVSASLAVVSSLALASLLLPHSSVGVFIIHFLGISATSSIFIVSTSASLAVALLILALYCKNKRINSQLDLSLTNSETLPNSKADSSGSLIDPNLVLDDSSPLTSKELLTLKLIAKKCTNYKVEVKGDEYSISYYNLKNIIEIYKSDNPSNKLEISVDDQGNIIKFRNDLENSPSLMRHIFTNVLKICHYEDEGEGELSIKIWKQGIKYIPEFHLKKFVTLLQSVLEKNSIDEINIEIEFAGEGGIDAGGITRDYANELFESLTCSKVLSFKKVGTTGYMMPFTEENQLESPWPELSSKEELLYNYIGWVLMFFYNLTKSRSDSFTIGRHFHNALFKATLCLTADEINTPFDQLSFGTKIKICRSLIEGYDASDIYARTLELLVKEELNEDELKEALLIALAANTFPEEYLNDGELSFIEFSNLENKEQLIHQSLMDHLFLYKGSYGPLGAQLAGIHAIAIGMKHACQGSMKEESNRIWDNEVMTLDFMELSVSIQGKEVTRDALANQLNNISIFFINNDNESATAKEEIEKKAGWLRDWLKEEASEEEFRKFLKYLTGSTSLPENADIIIYDQYRTFSPIPEIHTCSFEIRIAPQPTGDEEGYNDFTKENFITIIKNEIIKAETSYSVS